MLVPGSNLDSPQKTKRSRQVDRAKTVSRVSPRKPLCHFDHVSIRFLWPSHKSCMGHKSCPHFSHHPTMIGINGLLDGYYFWWCQYSQVMGQWHQPLSWQVSTSHLGPPSKPRKRLCPSGAGKMQSQQRGSVTSWLKQACWANRRICDGLFMIWGLNGYMMVGAWPKLKHLLNKI